MTDNEKPPTPWSPFDAWRERQAERYAPAPPASPPLRTDGDWGGGAVGRPSDPTPTNERMNQSIAATNYRLKHGIDPPVRLGPVDDPRSGQPLVRVPRDDEPGPIR